jgi:signal peptidase I
MKLSNIFSSEFFYTNGGILIGVAVILIIGIVAKWRLFVKCNQPGIAAIIPGYDIVVTLRIVGRPMKHFLFFLIPGVNIVFGFVLLIDLAKSFGKWSVLDAVLVVLFNVFYVLNLALAYNEEYQGPVYGISPDTLKERSADFA